MNPRILIACDKFKGTLAAAEVAAALERGILATCPAARITSLALSDGGEGFLAALEQAGPLRLVPMSVPGPLLEPHPGSLGLSADGRTVYIESSQATGFHLLPACRRNPLRTTSAGLARLLEEALALAPAAIYIGLGSSATCDAGLSIARHFGYRFWDSRGHELGGRAEDLLAIAAYACPALEWPEIYAAADVDNPPIGPRGGIRVYAPQKGASPAEVDFLERSIQQLITVLQPDFAVDLATLPHGGAAGCLGLGLYAFFGARLLSGSDFVCAQLQIADRIQAADFVITGEGRCDDQSLAGKIPGRIVALAAAAGKPVFMVTGQPGLPAALQGQIREAWAIADISPELADSAGALETIGARLGETMR